MLYSLPFFLVAHTLLCECLLEKKVSRYSDTFARVSEYLDTLQSSLEIEKKFLVEEIRLDKQVQTCYLIVNS